MENGEHTKDDLETVLKKIMDGVYTALVSTLSCTLLSMDHAMMPKELVVKASMLALIHYGKTNEIPMSDISKFVHEAIEVNDVTHYRTDV